MPVIQAGAQAVLSDFHGTVLAAAGGVVLVTVMTSLLVLCIGCKKKPKDGQTKAPKSKSRNPSLKSERTSEAKLVPTESVSTFSQQLSEEAPSAFSHRETKRQNPLFRGSIGDDPRDLESENAQTDTFAAEKPVKQKQKTDGGLERKSSVKSTASTYSGFGHESDSSGPTTRISTSGLTKEDKAAGYIGIVNGSPKESPKKKHNDTKTNAGGDTGAKTLASTTTKDPASDNAPQKRAPTKSKTIAKDGTSNDGAKKRASTKGGENGVAKKSSKKKKPSAEQKKPLSPEEAEKAKKDAERAARLAKMKEVREKKKRAEEQALEEALSVIDDLPE